MTTTLDCIRRHTGTALGIARRFARKLPKHVRREDIEQAALFGLWSWKRKHPDESADGWMGGLIIRIRGAIQDELRAQDWLPRKHKRERAEMRIHTLHDALAERLRSDDPDPEQALALKQEAEEARRAPLSERQAKFIDLAYYRDLKQSGAAVKMGLTEARVCQIHARAIQIMREHLAAPKETPHAKPRTAGGHVTSTLPEEGIDLRAELQRYQDWMVEQALIRSGGNKAQAARLLGLKRTALVMMLKARAPLLPRREQGPGLAKCGPLQVEEYP